MFNQPMLCACLSVVFFEFFDGALPIAWNSLSVGVVVIAATDAATSTKTSVPESDLASLASLLTACLATCGWRAPLAGPPTLSDTSSTCPCWRRGLRQDSSFATYCNILQSTVVSSHDRSRRREGVVTDFSHARWSLWHSHSALWGYSIRSETSRQQPEGRARTEAERPTITNDASVFLKRVRL